MNVLEQATTYGPQFLSDIDLIHSIFGEDEQSYSILKEMGSDPRKWVQKDLLALKGCGKQKAVAIHSVIELLKRSERRENSNPILDAPEKVAKFMKPYVSGLEIEKFWVLCLNRKNRLIKVVEHTSGTTSNSLVSPKNVLRSVIESGASAFICAHNHPSGSEEPSAADHKVTRNLKEISRSIDLDFLDHVIVTESVFNYYSFSESGTMG